MGCLSKYAGITGGAFDFPTTIELEDVLLNLMEFAGRAGAWFTTGGGD